MIKITFFSLMFLCAATFANAQTSLSDYLSRMPSAPKTCCGVSDQEKSSFQAAISGVELAMEKDLRQKRKASKAYTEANRDKIEDSLTPQSPEKPRKSGKLSKEEKKARAEEMMRQYGVSPEDRKKLKTMTQEEKTAWALSTSSRASGKMQADPQYQSMNQQVKSVADQQAGHQAALAQIETRKAVTAGILGKIQSLDQNAASAKARDIAPIERELSSMGDIITTRKDTERVSKLGGKLKQARMRHCETYSPQYLTLVAEYLSAVKASLPDYQKLDDAGRAQFTGVDKPIESYDGMAEGIKAINAYGDLLKQAFKYDLAH
ncbi:MAG: hypothetical protein K4571_02705 [Deltaproteobacteria bacterium]